MLLYKDTTGVPSSGLYLYLGYELGLWTSTGPPVKIVGPKAGINGGKNALNLLFLTCKHLMWRMCVLVF
jgi:hypothetical protein